MTGAESRNLRDVVMVLTQVPAARIWWIAREVGKIMGRAVVRPFNLAVGILCVPLRFVKRRDAQYSGRLESGFIYSGAIITLLILSPTNYVVGALALLYV